MALRPTARRLAEATRHDFVIVGGGSAGCVLAHRLAKDHGAKVLLLENGHDDRRVWDWWKVHMPAALTYNLAGTKFNWDFWTVPQKHMDGRRLHEPRGRGLGGSSSLNAMAYVRGHALDFERWAGEIGEGGQQWDYRHVLPYFRKAQNHADGASRYRGEGGPLQVCRKRTGVVEPINQAFIDAGASAGYPRTEDQNGFMQEGFGWMDMTVMPNGERANTSNCYLRPLLDPKTEEEQKAHGRLDVTVRRTATRLLFDGSKVVGVETAPGNMFRPGKQGQGALQQHLAGEVILCAGAVGSPQLLMVSGVGEAAELEKHGIQVRHELKQVGKNLQDHLEYYIQYLSKQNCSLYPYAATFNKLPEPISRYAYRQPVRSALSGLEWLLGGTGVASSNHFEVGGFIRSKPGLTHPDIQYHFIPAIVTGQLEIHPEHGYQAHCGTMRPTSRGQIQLAGSSTFDAPLIDPNFLATHMDVEDMRAGVRHTVEILEQEVIKGPFSLKRFKPTEEDLDLADDKAVDAWVRQNSHSAYHLSCTCAMGSVVDAEGRVLGLEGLRVADASIMPSMTSGNLNAPTIMLAEKIADAIQGQQLPPEDTQPLWHQPENWQTAQR